MNPPLRPIRLTILMSCIFTFLIWSGTYISWPAIASYLPTEEISVEYRDRSQSFSITTRGAANMLSITVRDPQGRRRNISCTKEAYEALNTIGSRYSTLKLLQNPTFQTPVALLQQPVPFIKLDSPSPKKPEIRLPLISFPILRILLALPFLIGPIILLWKIPRNSSVLYAVVTAYPIGIYLGLLSSSHS